MPDTLFALNRGNFRDCQNLFRGEHRQEYYCGDFWIEDSGQVEATAKRRVAGPHSVIHISTATRQFFRRTQKHIRDDASDISVLWFVKRGRLVFSNQCVHREVGPGEFLITRSNSPFFIELQPDARGVHEVLHVTTPTHLLRRQVGQEINSSHYVPMPPSGLQLAESILSGVFAVDVSLSDDTARTLVEAAMAAIGDVLRECLPATAARQTISGKQFEDVLRYIEIHLSDPNLSTAMVSRGCGISLRYMSLLFQLNQRSFSSVLWEQRLDIARNWLARTSSEEISVSEIAYGTGFKSPAHFSRKFKQIYGINPSDCRKGEATPVTADFPMYPAGTIQ